MWQFLKRHKRKVYITLGVFGSGYVLYKLYDANRRRLTDLEKVLAVERENDELIKAQIRAHFESIQTIADSTTLPHAMKSLDSRLAENLDLTPLMERLMQGKGQPNTLTTAEKLELWDRLKTMSFTKLISSLLSVTLLSLYIRVQVNILGRHLYVDTARGLGSSQLLDETELIDKNDEQQFLACADYLSNYGLPLLVSNVETAASDVLSSKQLKDLFNVSILHDTIIHIFSSFTSSHSPNFWANYLMPQDSGAYKFVAPSTSTASDLTNATKFELLMGETREVISSVEFANIVDVSMITLASQIVVDLSIQRGGNNLAGGIPLAKLIPRISQMSQLLLEESNRNRYISVVRGIPEVEMFFTLLYSSTSE